MSGSHLSDQQDGISAFHPEPLDRIKDKAGAQRALGADKLLIHRVRAHVKSYEVLGKGGGEVL